MSPEAAADSPVPVNFVLAVMDLDDTSVSTEEDHCAVTVRGLDRGMLDATAVTDLAGEHGLDVKDVYADVENPALTVEVGP